MMPCHVTELSNNWHLLVDRYTIHLMDNRKHVEGHFLLSVFCQGWETLPTLPTLDTEEDANTGHVLEIGVSPSLGHRSHH